MASFESVLHTIQIIRTELQKTHELLPDDSSSTQPKSLADFWNNFEAILQSLSQEATKMSLAFSQDPPPPQDVAQKLCRELEKRLLGLSSLYFQFSPAKTQLFGQTCWKQIKQFVLDLCDSTFSFICALKAGEKQLQSTGSLWEACDNFTKLAKSNQEAVAKICGEAIALVNDAIIELQDCSKVQEDPLPEVQAKLLQCSLGLVKCSKALLLKCKEMITNCSHVNNLDILAEYLDKISPGVDDLAGAFYGFQESEDQFGMAVEEAEKLAGDLKKMLSVIQTEMDELFVETRDSERLEFIGKAIDHNLSKFHSLTA